MKKVLALVLCLAMALSVCAIYVSAESALTWKDGQINDPEDTNLDDGQNLKFDNAYGFTFNIESDKVIGGEDNALIETVDEYKSCNPNWAISVLLAPEGDLYEVVSVVATPGSADAGIAAGINFDNGNIVLVAHSAYSHAEGANYESKLCALALKAGDKVKVADDKSSVYVLIPGVDAGASGSDKETVIVNKNVASGKSYTISQLFRQNESWQWGDDAPIAYPDEDGVTLTDGAFAVNEAHQLYDNPNGLAWMGFHSQCPDYMEVGYGWMIVDLGASYDITEAVLYTSSSVVSGATVAKITVLVSEDGENWAEFGSVDSVDDANVTVIKNSVAGSATAQYVQYRITATGYWMGVCEAEVYANVEVEVDAPATVKETITVDGVLDDNGWKADGWINVNKDNGAFQGGIDAMISEDSKNFSYSYQLRTDDTKLYVAAIYNDDLVKAGEANNTALYSKFRIWLNTDSEATVYTHFYDIYMEGDEVKTNAKYNTEKAANKAANIENSTLVANMSVADGKVYFEMSVDLAEFGGEEGFSYFFNAGHAVDYTKEDGTEGTDNIQMLYPAVDIPTEEGANKNANFPYAAWASENAATVNVADIALGEVTPGTGDAGIYAIAGLALVAILGTAVVIKKRA